jgi:hypothetical protein
MQRNAWGILMAKMSLWDVAVLLVAAYLSIVTLVRLMRFRRDQLIAKLQAEVAAEQKRKRDRERRARQARTQAAAARSIQAEQDAAS